MTVIGEDTFDPTRYAGSSMRRSCEDTGTRTVSPDGLVTSIEPVRSVSMPSMASATTPPSPSVTTGAATTDPGAAGGSYAHATVRTLARDSPTAFTATAS